MKTGLRFAAVSAICLIPLTYPLSAMAGSAGSTRRPSRCVPWATCGGVLLRSSIIMSCGSISRGCINRPEAAYHGDQLTIRMRS